MIRTAAKRTLLVSGRITASATGQIRAGYLQARAQSAASECATSVSAAAAQPLLPFPPHLALPSNSTCSSKSEPLSDGPTTDWAPARHPASHHISVHGES